MSNLICGLTDNEWDEIANNRPVHAISLVKNRLNCDFKYAKNLVDDARKMNPTLPLKIGTSIFSLLDNIKELADQVENLIKINKGEHAASRLVEIRKYTQDIYSLIRG